MAVKPGINGLSRSAGKVNRGVDNAEVMDICWEEGEGRGLRLGICGEARADAGYVHDEACVRGGVAGGTETGTGEEEGEEEGACA